MDAFIRAVTSMSRAAGLAGAILIAVAVFVICDMVIERYVFNLTTIWQIDAVTYCIIAATFISSPYVLMTRGHVNVDILPLYLGARARYVLAMFTSLVALAFCLALFVLVAMYWDEAYSEGWRSNTVWRARLWIPLLSMPVGMALVSLQYIVEIICLVTGRTSPFGLSEKQTAEDAARAMAREALGEVP